MPSVMLSDSEDKGEGVSDTGSGEEVEAREGGGRGVNSRNAMYCNRFDLVFANGPKGLLMR